MFPIHQLGIFSTPTYHGVRTYWTCYETLLDILIILISYTLNNNLIYSKILLDIQYKNIQHKLNKKQNPKYAKFNKRMTK